MSLFQLPCMCSCVLSWGFCLEVTTSLSNLSHLVNIIPSRCRSLQTTWHCPFVHPRARSGTAGSSRSFLWNVLRDFCPVFPNGFPPPPFRPLPLAPTTNPCSVLPSVFCRRADSVRYESRALCPPASPPTRPHLERWSLSRVPSGAGTFCLFLELAVEIPGSGPVRISLGNGNVCVFPFFKLCSFVYLLIYLFTYLHLFIYLGLFFFGSCCCCCFRWLFVYSGRGGNSFLLLVCCLT